MLGPIGVFDSGVGGLTVLRAIRAALPHEPLLYLGDTARVPYGTKSAEVVRRYAANAVQFLVGRGAKAVVIACNTASAVVNASSPSDTVPVLSVIEPGVEAALAATSGHVGVIGTEGTLRSGTYQASLRARSPGLTIATQACPLFVPLAEEGLSEHPATHLLAREYLEPLRAQGVDTLVLGCTHYPILRAVIESIMGPTVRVVDSAHAVAAALDRLLDARNLRATAGAGSLELCATDVSERVQRVGARFLGQPIPHVELVDL